MSFDMPKAGTWEQRGGWVVRALMRDFGLTSEQAAGLVGNLGFESTGFKDFHEGGQAAGEGGYGWAQWTGPRRIAFFAWCKVRALNPESDEANYGYLCEELRSSHSGTITALKHCVALDMAVWSVGQTFERPGGTTTSNLPGYADRVKYARRALAGMQNSPGPVIPPAPPPPAPFDIDADLVADLVRALQRVVDVEPDGRLGPITIAAIEQAQRRTT